MPVAAVSITRPGAHEPQRGRGDDERADHRAGAVRRAQGARYPVEPALKYWSA